MLRRATDRKAKKKATTRVARSVAGYMEDKTMIAEGRCYVTNTSISQFAAIPLRPISFDERCIAIADLYSLWRPLSIRFRSITLGGTANVCVAHMYPDSASTSVTTMEECVDLPAFKCGNGLIGAPLPDLLLDREYFAKSSMLNWYTTGTVPTDVQLENAGLLWYGNENSTMTTNNFRGIIEWQIEFKSMVDPQVSLARYSDRVRAQEDKVDEGVMPKDGTPPNLTGLSAPACPPPQQAINSARRNPLIRPLGSYFK